MLSNGQDFRKQFDFLRTCRISRIREFLYPYVVSCFKQNSEPTVHGFLEWKRTVKSQTYLALYEVEKVLGTSLILYLSSYKANNLETLTAAKNMFSRLSRCNEDEISNII